MISFLLAACGATPTEDPAIPATKAAATIYAKLTAEAPTLTPSVTASPTRTITPFGTATLTPTAINFGALPSYNSLLKPVQNTSVKRDGRALMQISQAGYGAIPIAALQPDGTAVVIGTKAGIGRYGFMHTAGKPDSPVYLDLKQNAAVESGVTALDMLPDSRQAVVGLGNGMLHVWNFNLWRSDRSIKAHTGEIGDIVLLRGGKVIATSGTYTDCSIAIWTLPDLKEEKRLTVSGEAIFDLAASEDGSALAAYVRGKGIYYWKDGNAQEVQLVASSSTERFHNDKGVAVNANGSLVAFVHENGTVEVVKAPQGTPVATLNTKADSVQTLFFIENDATLMTVGNFGTKLWKTSDWREAKNVTSPDNRINSVSLLPSQKMSVVSSNQGTVYLWNLTEFRVLGSLSGFNNRIVGAAISPDATKVYFAVFGNVNLYEWNLTSAQVKAIITNPKNFSYDALATDPTGKLLALSGSNYHKISLLELSTMKEVAELSGHGGPVDKLAFSPNGKYLASVSLDKTMRIWDVAAKSEIGRLEIKSIEYGLPSFNTSSTLVALPVLEWLPVWDIQKRALAGSSTEGASQGIIAAAFTPDGSKLVSMTRRSANLLDAKTLKIIMSTNLGASTNISLCKNPEMYFFGLADGRLMSAIIGSNGGFGPGLTDLDGPKLSIHEVTCSPQNNFVLTTSTDGTLRVFGSR